MKRMMMAVLLFLGLVAVSNAVAPAKGNLKGTWEYKVPAAPYEYSAGKLIFDEADGKPVVTVRTQNGSTIKVQDLKVEGDSFSFLAQVEYEAVKVNGKLDGGKITGKASSSQGVMEFTAEKPALKTN